MVCWFERDAALRTAVDVRDQAHDPQRRGPLVQDLPLPARRQHAAPRRGRPSRSRMNEIGRVSLRTTAPLFFDEYRRNRTTGSFILIDEATNETVGRRHDPRRRVGDPGSTATRRRSSSGTSSGTRAAVAREERWAALGAGGATVWFTGLSGSGKSTVAAAVEHGCWSAAGRAAYLLDGDNLRHGLNGDLGFDRGQTATRTCAGSARSPGCFADAGVVALVPLISPYRDGPRPGPRRSTRPPASASSRSSSTRRSRSASGATRRASTPRPGPARSPASPASTTPTSHRSTPSWCCTRRRPDRPRSAARSSPCSPPSVAPGPVAEAGEGVR